MKTFPMLARIRNQGNGPTRIDVFDDIGDGGWPGEGLTAQSFTAQLATVTGPLDVHINSYGGSVADGTAIRNAIRAHQGPKRTIVDGIAASIASVIMQAGDERIVQPGSMVMIHDASTVCAGNAADMSKMAADLDKHSQNIAQMYAERSGSTADQWRDAMRAETWYTADEAVAAGLADKVGTGTAALPVGLDLAAFQDIPDRIVARLRELPRQQPTAAYAPQPYHREDWENVLCPVCGKYNDDDGKYCGQCGIELAGRDDVTSERATSSDGDGSDAMNAAGARVADAALSYLREQAKQHGDLKAPEAAATEPTDAASIDESDWDGPKAMSLAAKSDDPAATYKQICAGRRDGDPSKQDSWALPYRYPGKGPNAAGVRNALSRLPQTDDLTNKAAAQALLERLMKQINPDYDSDADNAAPAWISQTQPAAPAWLNLAKEANK